MALNNDGSLFSNFGNNGIINLNYSYRCSSYMNGYLYLISQDDTNKNSSIKKFDLNTGTTISSNVINFYNIDDNIANGPNNQIIIINRAGTEADPIDIYLYSTEGILNTNFGNGGSLKVDNGYIRALTDGNSIYITSSDINNKISKIYKFDSNGVLDNSFGINGIATINDNIVTDLKVLNNQLYLTGVNIDANNKFHPFIERLNTNGSHDNTFNNNGIYIYNPTGNQQQAESLLVLSPTSIIVAGKTIFDTNYDVSINKFIVTPNLATSEANLSQFAIENPVGNTLNYQTKEAVKQIELYSAEGRLVRTISTNNADVSALAKGMYVAKITFKNGQTASKKIIKK